MPQDWPQDEPLDEAPVSPIVAELRRISDELRRIRWELQERHD